VRLQHALAAELAALHLRRSAHARDVAFAARGRLWLARRRHRPQQRTDGCRPARAVDQRTRHKTAARRVAPLRLLRLRRLVPLDVLSVDLQRWLTG